MESRYQLVSDGVYTATSPFFRFGPEEVRFLEEVVASTGKGRARICAHRTPEDPLHEMLILISAGSYVRPHRHLGKSESHHVVRGEADVVFFDDEGRLTSVERVGSPGSGRAFYYRISEPVFHSLIVRGDAYVVHETTNGPFVPGDADVAPWAPDEGDADAAADYLLALEASLEEAQRR